MDFKISNIYKLASFYHIAAGLGIENAGTEEVQKALGYSGKPPGFDETATSLLISVVTQKYQKGSIKTNVTVQPGNKGQSKKPSIEIYINNKTDPSLSKTLTEKFYKSFDEATKNLLITDEPLTANWINFDLEESPSE